MLSTPVSNVCMFVYQPPIPTGNSTVYDSCQESDECIFIRCPPPSDVILSVACQPTKRNPILCCQKYVFFVILLLLICLPFVGAASSSSSSSSWYAYNASKIIVTAVATTTISVAVTSAAECVQQGVTPPIEEGTVYPKSMRGTKERRQTRNVMDVIGDEEEYEYKQENVIPNIALYEVR